MPLIGSHQFAGRLWAPNLKVSGKKSPAEEWIVDPSLPPLGTDPRYPSLDQIVIPRGRILGTRADTVSYTGKAALTLHDGVNTKPCGYAESNVFRQWEEKISYMPEVSRDDLIEVPFVSAINGAYGALAAGDKITGYFGSTTAAVGAPNDKGKIVKWVERRVYAATTAASAIVQLGSANLRPFAPSVIGAVNGATAVTTGAISVAWNSTFGAYVATFGQSVTMVWYDYGQSAAQIAGEVVRIEPISASHELDGWLKWVTDNYGAWEYPPQVMRVPTTDVTSETPSTVVAGTQYRLANRPVASWKPITVVVTGTLYNLDGTTTALSSTTMSAADLPFTDYTLGTYYNINPVTGDLYFSGNVVVNSVAVSYSYETAYDQGRLFNAGQQGLTDGRYSNVAGTPANLEISGVAGSLRCIVY